MHDFLIILGYIAFLTITLSCLGMLGMAMYITQTSTREISIRKVMGASVSQLVLMLSRSFIVLIVIAVVIGGPVSYFLGELFLSQFAYRIEVGPLLMLSGVVMIGTLGLAVVASQTIKAAVGNPVTSLRHE